jgi:hypothetical protein
MYSLILVEGTAKGENTLLIETTEMEKKETYYNRLTGGHRLTEDIKMKIRRHSFSPLFISLCSFAVMKQPN